MWGGVFPSMFSFRNTDDSWDTRELGRGPTLFLATTSTSSRIFKDLFLILHVRRLPFKFFIKPLVITRLILTKIYNLAKLPFDWSMMNVNFCLLDAASPYDWVMINVNLCLLDDLLLDLVTKIWLRKEVDLKSHQLSP